MVSMFHGLEIEEFSSLDQYRHQLDKNEKKMISNEEKEGIQNQHKIGWLFNNSKLHVCSAWFTIHLKMGKVLGRRLSLYSKRW